MSDKPFRVVIFQENDHWIAQMLEHDLCAQGPDLKTVRARFLATYCAELIESERSGREPLEGIAPAPAEFEQMWRDRSPFQECEKVNGKVPIQLAIAA